MDDQRDTIAFLSDASHYGAIGPVEQITTHASIIFLVGDRAWKLKRAVHYSYLDYSTAAQREKFCRAELALNRRTAPELYLGVHALTRQRNGALAFDGDGSVVDWILEMRRFDQATLFDRLAETKQLTPKLLRDLADRIYQFHRDAEIVTDRGGQRQMATTIATNDDNLRLVAPILDADVIEALRVRSTTWLSAVGELLEGRRERGAVRRCHGDLHLGNICLVDGRPTLFDGIEFNDDFSSIDVLYDLAFLLMDLRHRQLRDGANLVFNRYLDRNGDVEGLRTMPLFLSMRAAVRAHVLGALLRSESQAVDHTATASAARSYLTLALELLETSAPRLIAIGGLSGSGKSTVARALAPTFLPAPGARIIRSDVLRKRLAGAPPETRLPRESYTQQASQLVYSAAYEEARSALVEGYSVIVDAAFLHPEERQAIEAVARAARVPFTGIWLDAAEALLAHRLDERRDDASDADRAVLTWQLALDTGTIGWTRIDTTHGPNETAAVVAKAIGLASTET